MAFVSRTFALIPLLLLASVTAGCSTKSATPVVGNGDPPVVDDPPPTAVKPKDPSYVNNDAGVLVVGSRGKDAGGPPDLDASVTPDASACGLTLQPGDLSVQELMIATHAGDNDYGEWVEIRNVRDCALNLNGLHIESPYTSTYADSIDITTDLILQPNEVLLAANSDDDTQNHLAMFKGGLAQIVLWDGSGTYDVLNDTGDVVTLKLGETVIDTVAYPRFSNLVYGASVEFPQDCSLAARNDFFRWSTSTYSWLANGDVPKGTPGWDNDDVACY